MGTHPIFESDFDCLTEDILYGRYGRPTRSISLWSEWIRDRRDSKSASRLQGTHSAGCGHFRPLPANRLRPNPGEPDVPSLVSHVFVVAVLPDQALRRSETCAVEDECSTRTRPGADGTDG